MSMIFERSPSDTRSFLAGWSDRMRPSYTAEYGGVRAGVPKGEEIPFPPHKVVAGLALLYYGAPKNETLSAIARRANVSSALLRVWRTEDRFLSLYRRAVWECADAFVNLLARSWQESWPSPSDEFDRSFGIALQQAVLHRICTDLLGLDLDLSKGLPPRWMSENNLVGQSPRKYSSFSRDELKLLRANAYMLLSASSVRLYGKHPGLGQWVSQVFTRQIVHDHLKDAMDQLAKGKYQEVMGILTWATSSMPVHDLSKLHEIGKSPKFRARRE